MPKRPFLFLRGEVARDLAYLKSKGETVISLVELFFGCFDYSNSDLLIYFLPVFRIKPVRNNAHAQR